MRSPLLLWEVPEGIMGRVTYGEPTPAIGRNLRYPILLDSKEIGYWYNDMVSWGKHNTSCLCLNKYGQSLGIPFKYRDKYLYDLMKRLNQHFSDTK